MKSPRLLSRVNAFGFAILVVALASAQSSPLAQVGRWGSLPAAQSLPESEQLVPAGKVPPVKFGPAEFIGFYAYPDAIAVGDLNGDGKLDLVVGDQYTNKVYVLMGNGDGTFQAPATYYLDGQRVLSVAIGNLTGDGIPDLVVASPCPNLQNCGNNEGVLSVLLGNGDGTFQPAVSYSSGGYGADSVAIADVNGDGEPDLIVANECQEYSCSGSGGDGIVSVLLGNGDGTFQSPVSFGSGGIGATSVAVGDVNGDGVPDLVVANGCQSEGDCNGGVVSVLLGNGDGTFKAPVTYSAGGYDATSVAIGDFNGDGHPDVVAASICLDIDKCKYGLGPGGLGVLIGNGDGTFQPTVSYTTGGLWATSVAIGDLNGDGTPDLVVANMCQTTDRYGDCNGYRVMGLLRGNGDGTFQAPKTYSSGGDYPLSVAIGDLNGDGRPDLAVADQLGVGVLLNETVYSTKAALTSSRNPAAINQTVTFTATITSNPPVPNGEVVTFYNGKTEIGTGATTNGVASLTTSFSKAGKHTIKASYPGDAFRKASSATVKQVVNP